MFHLYHADFDMQISEYVTITEKAFILQFVIPVCVRQA